MTRFINNYIAKNYIFNQLTTNIFTIEIIKKKKYFRNLLFFWYLFQQFTLYSLERKLCF